MSAPRRVTLRLLLDRQLRRVAERLRLQRDWYLIVAAMVIGLIMGGLAIAFILPLRAVERWAVAADPAVLRWLVPILPAAGGLLTGLTMWVMRGQGRVPGVSAVMYAIHRLRSQLPLRFGVRKWIASTITITSGGSAGAEGPIVTIGAVLGSNIGRLLKVAPQQQATLLGCGAAAGLSAVFNAPIAAIFFVLEVLLRDFSLRTFTPIVIASVVASAFSQGVLGTDPIFPVEAGAFQTTAHRFTLPQIPNFVFMGLICGLAAAAFIKALDLIEGFFGRLRVHAVLKPAIGGALLGVLAAGYLWLVPPAAGLPEFYGNGYPVIERLLDFASYPAAGSALRTFAALFVMLSAIAILKAVATCLTLGSGGSGGLFAPSLLMGAAIGGAFGCIVNGLGWLPAAHPALYALVGMGAMVAATTHAPLAAILIVYEITRSYETVLPLMLAAVISTIVARIVIPESVYTLKLSRMGVRLGAMSDLTMLRRLTVQDVPLAEPVLVRQDDSAQRLLELAEQRAASDFIVVDDRSAYCGLVTGADLRSALVYREAIPLLQVSELVRNDIPTVGPEESLDVVLDKFARHDVQSLAVLRNGTEGSILGLITRSRLMEKYHQVLGED